MSGSLLTTLIALVFLWKGVSGATAVDELLRWTRGAPAKFEQEAVELVRRGSAADRAWWAQEVDPCLQALKQELRRPIRQAWTLLLVHVAGAFAGVGLLLRPMEAGTYMAKTVAKSQMIKEVFQVLPHLKRLPSHRLWIIRKRMSST